MERRRYAIVRVVLFKVVETMKITFLGTRGYIDARIKRHYNHTATLIAYKGKRILIDCGIDWTGKLGEIKPHAILLTHAHPDHAWGLADGAPCPVYATQESWDVRELQKFLIRKKRIVRDGQTITIAGMTIRVFAEEHSIRCPAVGYRITAGSVTIFYAGDVIAIHERQRALRGCDLYIGDGASIARPIVRQKNGRLFGHTPITTQLGWCKKEGVKCAIFTHCGSQIVEQKPSVVEKKIVLLGTHYGVDAQLAYDGMKLIVR